MVTKRAEYAAQLEKMEKLRYFCWLMFFSINLGIYGFTRYHIGKSRFGSSSRALQPKRVKTRALYQPQHH